MNIKEELQYIKNLCEIYRQAATTYPTNFSTYLVSRLQQLQPEYIDKLYVIHSGGEIHHINNITIAFNMMFVEVNLYKEKKCEVSWTSFNPENIIE